MTREIHVMTWNIRRRMGPLSWRPADRWSLRRPLLQERLESSQPTVLGVQEALADQAVAVAEGLGIAYRMVGRGRERGGRGEGCPVFYDERRVELLDAEQFALSDRPSVAGSRSWGNAVPRIVVRAELRDRDDGGRFVMFNTHLDPFSARSRLASARDLRERISAEEMPVVLTGDLNAGPRSDTLAELFAGGVLEDAWAGASSRTTPEWGTFGDYRRPREGRRIDWIAVTPDVEVVSASIDARPVEGRWPSDHLPVHASVRLPVR